MSNNTDESIISTTTTTIELLREYSLPYRALWYLVSPKEAFTAHDGSDYIDMANIVSLIVYIQIIIINVFQL